MTYNFSQLETKIKETNQWLRTEYQSIRTGRATPTLLDTIQVDNFGSKMPISQMANIGTEDARTLRVSPYDSSQIKEIEKAITNANLGVGISSGSDSVRITFPEITSETRKLLIKAAKDKLEDARISLRGARDDVWAEIQSNEHDGTISKDEKFSAKDEMESLIKDANEALDEILKKKEAEISE